MNPTEGVQPVRRRDRGFSVLEVVIVLAITLIMIAVGLSTYASHKRLLETDLAAEQVVDLMRDAYQRALAGRTTFIFEITPSTDDTQGRVRVLTLAEEVVREEALPPFSQVAIGHPQANRIPASPFNFNRIPATSQNGQTWRVFFRMNGQATNSGVSSTITPQSGTLVFFVPATDGTVRPGQDGLTRAITLFGPTGSIRYWRWQEDPGVFVPR